MRVVVGWLVESPSQPMRFTVRRKWRFQVREGPAPVGGLVFVHVDPEFWAADSPVCSAVSANLFRTVPALKPPVG